jgi:hypothetical protein
MRSAARSNAKQLSRIQRSAPVIASRRMVALNKASPVVAAQLWSSWTFEKWMTFNAAAMNVVVAMTHSVWAPWWLRGSASHQRETNVFGQALAPITKQIQRNRRRKSASAY